MITRDKIIRLLSEEDPGRVLDSFRRADRVRRNTLGDEIHLRALIEISSHCTRNCCYCGIRARNHRLKRYRMSDDEIALVARAAAARGRRTIVLQAGEDPKLTPERVARLVERIKRETDMAVALSLGEYPDNAYRMMKEAGADRYLLRHETSDPALYRMMHPGSSLDERIDRLRALSELGFQTGSGFIIGLPGQTIESIANDILLMKSLNIGMAGVGPFIPHPNTPLADAPPGDILLTLKALAAARITMPYTHMPATTAVSTRDPAARIQALRCGANVLMPKYTPEKFMVLYDIYPGRVASAAADAYSSDPDHYFIELVKTMGRTVSSGYGHYRNPAGAAACCARIQPPAIDSSE